MDTPCFNSHENSAQTQPMQAKAATPSQSLHKTLACPYCEQKLFDGDDALRDHVNASHDSEIQGSGVKENIELFWKLIKDEALHRGRKIAIAQNQRRTEDQMHVKDPSRGDAAARGQMPDITRLTIQSKSPSEKGKHSMSSSSASRRGGLVPPSVPDQSGALPMHTPTDEQWPDLVLQLDSRPISQETLAKEAKTIHAALTMVEAKCIHAVREALIAAKRDEDSNQARILSPDYWNAFITLHRTLLYEHHDLFLVLQHPSASPELRQLTHAMPIRMWEHGVHSFLELLRRRLPGSLEHMLTFILLAYQMMALLYETAPAFENVWIECLGDLGRYRMAIEDEDLQVRKTWTEVARSWYSKAAHKSPSVGRLYHRMAILAMPNALQQLYLYCRSLTCVNPFSRTRGSILTLSERILDHSSKSYLHVLPVETNFVRVHGILSEEEQTFERNDFNQVLKKFIEELDRSIGRVTSKWKEQGAYMAIANISSLFDYGSEKNFLRLAFEAQLQNKLCGQISYPMQPHSIQLDPQTAEAFSCACRLTFDTLDVVLQRFGDKNVLTHFHILLAFLSQVTTLPCDTTYIFRHIQWKDFVFFLNTLAKSTTITPAIESPHFIHRDEQVFRPLPEDYIIRGQLWAHSYYPTTWFSAVIDEEDRLLELASTTKLRTERILWLGVCLASESMDFKYCKKSRQWSVKH